MVSGLGLCSLGCRVWDVGFRGWSFGRGMWVHSCWGYEVQASEAGISRLPQKFVTILAHS